MSTTITSAQFVKSAVDVAGAFDRDIPHIAFIGRSNVGKSSTINALTKQKGLAKTSSFPGRTKEINLFLINNKYYFVDLPGYGYTKVTGAQRELLTERITNYLFNDTYTQKKVVVIIDALVGATESDLDMIHALEHKHKDIVVIANKVDKIKPSQKVAQLKKLQQSIGNHILIPYSAEKKIGLAVIVAALFD